MEQNCYKNSDKRHYILVDVKPEFKKEHSVITIERHLNLDIIDFYHLQSWGIFIVSLKWTKSKLFHKKDFNVKKQKNNSQKGIKIV